MSMLVTVIVIVLVICQLPYRAMDLHLYYKETEAQNLQYTDDKLMESLYIARNYLLCLMMADKAARPIIYSKLAPQLADAFDEVINCTMCSRAYTGQARMRTTSGGDPGCPVTDTVSYSHDSANTTITTTTGIDSNGYTSSGYASNGSAHKTRSSKRNLSTSSKAPLTGGSGDSESGSEHEHVLQTEEVPEVDEEQEEVQVIMLQQYQQERTA
jgi:hypothetical protein